MTIRKTLVCGFDPSLTSAGISDATRHELIKSAPRDDESPEQNAMRRANEIARAVTEFVNSSALWRGGKDQPERVLMVVEAPMIGPQSNHLLECGVLLHAVETEVRALIGEQREVEFYYVPPSSLKKFMVGKGSAKKDEMKLLVFQQHGKVFDKDPGVDKLHAWGLYKYGEACAAGTLIHVPSARRGKGGKKPKKVASDKGFFAELPPPSVSTNL